MSKFTIQENILLAPFTYYKIGGPARYFAQPQSIEDLQKISEFIDKHQIKFFILGAGSNILFDDAGFSGIVIQTSKLNSTLTESENLLHVGASTRVIDVLRFCMTHGLTSLNFLVGIPGNMGGVFYMNAGTKSGEIKDVVVEVKTFHLKTGQTQTFQKEALHYTYRTQHFLEPDSVILEGKLKFTRGKPETVQKQIQDLLEARKRSQPIDKPSCGSVFKNPPGHAAWKLIEEAGLRGHQIGQAQISPMHTNFIVNLGNAKASDVRALIALIQEKVQEKFNILLEAEVKMIAP